MNIGYTTFGLGLAMGLFLSWIWDVFQARRALNGKVALVPKTGKSEPISRVEPTAQAPAPNVPTGESAGRRVFLEIDGRRHEEVQEADFLRWLAHWNIAADSPEGLAMADGRSIRVGSHTVQLVYG